VINSQLISIGNPIANPVHPSKMNDEYNGLPNELLKFLIKSNGLLAFESALLIRPLVQADGIYDVFEWNHPELWKSFFADDQILATLFFAEDAFGCQYGYFDNKIVQFDPETGCLDFLCESFDMWCNLMMSEYEQYTGYALIHEWQLCNGAIKPEHRLCPVLPFVLGGEYRIDNLYSVHSVQGMKHRANIALQIRDLPDGTNIKFAID